MSAQSSTAVLAIATSAALMLSIASVRAVDSNYPDWRGQWNRFIVPGVDAPMNPGFDQTKPWGLEQQAPLTAEYRKVLMDSMADQVKGGLGNYPSARCVPGGMPHMMFAFMPQEYVITPNTTYILLGYNDHYRRVFTDGRELPKNPEPAWFGYSVGKWVGNTFVVESSGFNDKSWIDDDGHPHSDALHTTERFRRPDVGHLIMDITIDDPKAYVKPWSATVHFHLLPDYELIESVCDNEKDQEHMLGR